ncbi:OmpA family protein [Flavobacterium praedii]|uniref:OmpA family protein n=1 Tax=Flavobacterium praedii TaxID=3002900 RepID=UPI0024819C1E|nr:OmpA family protein [Flavobacterium praedii]
MSKKFLYLLGILLAMLLGTWMYPDECCANEEKQGTDEKIMDVTASGNSFQLQGNGFDYKTNQNLKFLNDDSNLLNPISDSINIGIVKLKEFLDQSPNQKLLITGYATSLEKNTTSFENLGFARAENIKNYFVTMGIPKEKFTTDGKIIDSWKRSGDTLLGPAKYQFISTEATSNDNKWNSLRDSINANPLVLYFKTNQINIQLNQEEAAKIATIQRYLEKVPDSKISAIGHTDNVGSPENNMLLGQERADFAKRYLIKKGIDETKIISTSKGQTEPIADNESAEGKAKNRRTVITINK